MNDSQLENLQLKEITKQNLGEMLQLQVAPNQKNYVAPNSVSIAQAHYADTAWMRGIYENDTPVGFLLILDPVAEEGDDAKFNGIYFLWRFMIAEAHQKKGFGRKALDILCDYIRTRPNGDYLYASYEEGEFGPKEFYLKYGFEETGEKAGKEPIIRKKL